jgi:cellulose synthase/poly-beta-1,6-N-acetylglucosamine synthase-like glycosyltransferase
VIDADSLLEPTALLKAVRPFMETSDNVIAVGGTVGIVNGCTIKNGQVINYKLPRNFLARLQVVEYIRAFLMARLAASRKGSLAIISGAFGIFRRDIAVAVGGYDTTTVGEDMELVLKMHRHMLESGAPYSVRYVPEPVCWTEAPESLKFLSNQRTRWQRGALECLSRHKKMVFNPRYGRLGMVTLPTFVLVDLISPIAEILGYILMAIFVLLGWLDVHYFFALTAIIFSYGVLISIMSLLLEQDEIERFSNSKDLWLVLLTAVTENFGFRQICSFWRIRGLIQHFRGMKPTWGKMERRGFKVSSEQKTMP